MADINSQQMDHGFSPYDIGGSTPVQQIPEKAAYQPEPNEAAKFYERPTTTGKKPIEHPKTFVHQALEKAAAKHIAKDELPDIPTRNLYLLM